MSFYGFLKPDSMIKSTVSRSTLIGIAAAQHYLRCFGHDAQETPCSMAWYAADLFSPSPTTLVKTLHAAKLLGLATVPAVSFPCFLCREFVTKAA